jgi:SsrA-binding protein
LLHAHEIKRIQEAIGREGYTAIPMSLYWKDGRAKVELGLGKGKKTKDKRQDIAKKTADREAQAAMGRGRKGM